MCSFKIFNPLTLRVTYLAVGLLNFLIVLRFAWKHYTVSITDVFLFVTSQITAYNEGFIASLSALALLTLW